MGSLEVARETWKAAYGAMMTIDRARTLARGVVVDSGVKKYYRLSKVTISSSGAGREHYEFRVYSTRSAFKPFTVMVRPDGRTMVIAR